jgi:xylulokinase
MGVMLSAGGALRWFRDAWCQAEVAQAAREGRDVYDLLMDLAAQTPAGAEGLLFLPYLSGERTPHGDPHARGVFCGLTLRHGKGHLTRAVIEGVTFGLRDSLEIIRSLGLPAGEVYATGGGARSPLWRQIQADVFGVPVVAERAGEGPALGAALLAGAGVGAFTLAEGAARAVQTADAVAPVAAQVAVYDAAYALYDRLYPALKDIFPLLEQG